MGDMADIGGVSENEGARTEFTRAPGTEVSETFVRGMRDRMATSFFKYGAVADAYPHKVNAIESLQARLEKYYDTGNTEWLIDAANFAMIEFMHPSHRRAHFKPTEAGESPGRASYDSGLGGDETRNRDLTDKEYREIHG